MKRIELKATVVLCLIMLLVGGTTLSVTASQMVKENEDDLLPDLIVSTDIEKTSHRFGVIGYNITWTVTNIGDATSPKLQLGIWGYINGIRIVTRDIGPLEPDESQSRLGQYVFSGCFNSFTFTTKGVADPDYRLDEKVETNNEDIVSCSVRSRSHIKNICLIRFMQRFPMIFRFLKL